MGISLDCGETQLIFEDTERELFKEGLSRAGAFLS